MFAIEGRTGGTRVEAALRDGDLAPAIRLGQYGVHYVPSSPEISELKGELRDPFYLHEVLRRRITSYNVCYTKLLRIARRGGSSTSAMGRSASAS